MAGYTDSPYRFILKEFGVSLAYTELISAEGIARRIPKTLKMLKFIENEPPLVIQIFGSNVDSFSKASAYVSNLNPVSIDINMGCCAPKVTASGSGAALLKDPLKLSSIAENTVKFSKVPVSAKIRIGWDNQNLNYREIVKILENSGICRVAVHGRTSKQKYTGSSNWDIIGEIATNTKIPVIGSGDIHSYSEALEKITDYSCKAVMIGRSAVGNPWIFNGVKPDITDILSTVKKHLKLMVNYYGDYGVILSRKHLVKYFHGFRNAAALRGKLVSAETFSDVFSILDSFDLEIE